MRRRNGSKKIPGVILRARPDQPRSGSQDMGPFDELEFDISELPNLEMIMGVDIGLLDQPGGAPEPYTARNIQAGERPFSGINISCSGVSNKVLATVASRAVPFSSISRRTCLDSSKNWEGHHVWISSTRQHI